MGTGADVSPGAFLLLVIRPAELANVSRTNGDLGRVAHDTVHDRVRMDPAAEPRLPLPELRVRLVEQLLVDHEQANAPYLCMTCSRGSLARGPRGRVSLKLV